MAKKLLQLNAHSQEVSDKMQFHEIKTFIWDWIKGPFSRNNFLTMPVFFSS